MVNSKNLIISESIQEYMTAVKRKFNVEKVFLFGSYISGLNDTDSDIDLAIISSSFTGNRIMDNSNLYSLTWKIDTRIEPIAFRPEDFNSNNLIADEIIKTGVEISIN